MSIHRHPEIPDNRFLNSKEGRGIIEVIASDIKRSVIIILREDSKRLSAAHFRIFMNQNGLLMLEDMSTNGTMVDKVILGVTRISKFLDLRVNKEGAHLTLEPEVKDYLEGESNKFARLAAAYGGDSDAMDSLRVSD